MDKSTQQTVSQEGDKHIDYSNFTQNTDCKGVLPAGMAEKR